MDQPDYEQFRDRLTQAGDAELLKVVRVFDAVFRSDRLRPRAETLAAEQALIDAVRASFPTPFARKFFGWLDADEEYAAALSRWSDPFLSAEKRDRAQSAVSRHFRDAFLEMWACWLQLVRFLPFILISALKRLGDDVLKEHAAKELALALHHYRTFYEKYDSERKREADQLHLLISLNRLFRRLSNAGALTDQFVFAPLIGDSSAGFAALLPDRFDAAMQLILQLRNRVIHDHVEDYGPDITRALNDLVRWCFLDIVAALAPIGRAFGLTYVLKLAIEPAPAESAEVAALDFSGIGGPQEVRYRVSSRPQPDDFSFVDLRLYLVAREQQPGGRQGVETLDPENYLDLTPFLIAERLRDRASLADLSAVESKRLLFSLQQYLEPLSQLTFSELGGTGKKSLGAGQADGESRVLLEKISGFKLRISQLSAQIQLKDSSSVTARSARRQLWMTSTGYLAGLLDVQAYDADGERTAAAPTSGLKQAYDEALFVDPAEGAIVDGFMRSPQRCLLLVGGSGFGKSNLLVDRYFRWLRGGRLAVFLAARQFDMPSFRNLLTSKVVGQISARWKDLGDLDAFLDENGEMLAIFVDAINEYTGPRGPLSLLADLVATVRTEPALRRCRIIATCRSESWARYLQQIGSNRPLDPAIFHAPGGDAIRIGGFDDPALRQRLYGAYQRRYRLRPERFESLAEPVQALVAQPLMMALIAETYANGDVAAAAAIEIPQEIDYFTLFRRLTDRKLADAQVLVPSTERMARERLPALIEELCEKLAAMIYDRLMAPDATGTSNRDALPLDSVDKSHDLQPFVRGAGTISALEAALQVGLIEQTRVTLRSPSGRLVAGTAIAFFHDQYTQYWLAHAYQAGIIGWLDRAALDDPDRLATITAAIDRIIDQSVHAPILLGALDHWLQMNLQNFHDGRIAAILPALDRWAEHESAAVRHYAVAAVANLILRRFVSAEDAIQAIFRVGGHRLRHQMASAFVDFWPALPPAAAAAFVDSCNPRRDAGAIEGLGEIFIMHLMQDQDRAVAYLEAAIRPLTITSLLDPVRFWRQYVFVFGIWALFTLTNFDQPRAIEAVQRLFRSKCQMAIDLLLDDGGRLDLLAPAKVVMRKALYAGLNWLGIRQWNKFARDMPLSGNDRFFLETDGVVQQQVLAEFLPYLVDLHNGDLARLSLEPGSPFRALMLRMLDFRPTSAIGYVAVVCLPSLLRHADWPVTEAFIMEVIERRTPSASFFGNLLMCNLSYTDSKLARPSLDLIHDRIVPFVLNERVWMDWSIIFCIATLDVPTLWGRFETILRLILDELERRGDPEAMASFGSVFFRLAYCRDLELGRRTIELLCREPDRFLGPVWREATMTLFAAMLTRHPGALQATLTAAGMADSLLREARAYQTDAVIYSHHMFQFQVDGNRCAAWLFAFEPRLRLAFVKYCVGSLACGSSLADLTACIRPTVTTILDLNFGSDPDSVPQGRLSVEEITAWFATARRRRRSRQATPRPEDAPS